MIGSIGQPQVQPDYRYDGYLAYSRLDRDFARTLQQDVEARFRSMSPKLRGSRKRILLCRDETDFTASEDLPASIRQKLAESRKLIVICSPNARQCSYWVPREIAYFRELSAARPASTRIIAVLAGGDDPVRDTAFPEGLAKPDSEPLAVEFRAQKVPAEIPYDQYRRRDGVLRVLAPLLDAEYPNLKDRQAEYERRRLRNRILALSILSAVFAAIALYALIERNRAVDRLADNYWAQAAAAVRDADWLRAAQMFASTASTARNKELRDDALFPLRQLIRDIRPQYHLSHRGNITGLSEDSRGQFVLTWSEDSTARLWEAVGGRMLGEMKHDKAVASARFVAGDSLVFTYSAGGVARLWRVPDASPATPPLEHGAAFTTAETSADGRIVATVGGPKVLLWSAARGWNPVPLQHESQVEGIRFNPAGTIIASWTTNDKLRLWDANSGNLLKESGIGTHVTSAVYSQMGTRLLLTTLFGAGSLWKFGKEAPARVIGNAEFPADGAGLSPDENSFVTWTRDGSLYVRDARSGSVLCGPMHHDDGASVQGARFDPSGDHILSWAMDEKVRIWNSRTCRAEGTPIQHALVNGAEFAGTDNRVVTWDSTAVGVWDRMSGAALFPQTRLPSAIRSRAVDAASGLMLAGTVQAAHLLNAADGTSVGLPMPEGGALRGALLSRGGNFVWTWGGNGATRWAIQRVGFATRLPHAAVVKGFTAIRGSRWLLSWDSHGDVYLWDANAPAKPTTFVRTGLSLSSVIVPASEHYFLGVTIDGQAGAWNLIDGGPAGTMFNLGAETLGTVMSATGTRLFSWDAAGNDTIWSVPAGKPIATRRHGDVTRFAQFNEDETRLVTCTSENHCDILNPQDGRSVSTLAMAAAERPRSLWQTVQLRILPGIATGPQGAMFTPKSGRVLIWDANRTARIFSSSEGSVLGAVIRHGGGINCATSDSAGRFIVTYAKDGSINAVRAVDGVPLLGTARHEGAVTGAAWIPSSQRLITYGADGTARIWDLGERIVSAAVLRHDGPVLGIAVSRDGRLLLTWASGGAAYLWDAQSGSPIGSPMRHRYEVDSAAFLDDLRIVTRSAEDIRIWFARDASPALPVVRSPVLPSGQEILLGGRAFAVFGDSPVLSMWTLNGGQSDTARLLEETTVFVLNGTGEVTRR